MSERGQRRDGIALLAAFAILEAIASPVLADEAPTADNGKTCFLYSAYDYRAVGSEDGILVISKVSGDPIDVCRANALGEAAWQVIPQPVEETQLGRAYVNGTRQ